MSIAEQLSALRTQRDALIAALQAKGQDITAGSTLAVIAEKLAALKPAGYVNPADVITPANRIRSFSVSGSYASATYYTDSGCSAYLDANGNIAIVMQGGTTASYENINFSLASATGTGVSGAVLAGQSVCTYTSASTGGRYCAIITGVTASVNISVNLSGLNGSYDYVTAAITLTAA